ncbi:ParA family protein [Enhygromyxa salina]|uniref:Chromosome-partitioning ATPase Soj n=1 Tax=Enhygromyxa salina TaxID=215803 RepID=A0A2S9YNE6_9BACT|nr:AAA family ATPase [Enhygromyxa salina]PRQ06608.1 Chromosome-partitioning ATPase Soj [Enhygromyxa salina]
MKKIAFFNNKGGVGKTTLVYHVAHMLVERGQRVLLMDLDPQANLSAMCVSEERLEQLWPDALEHPQTIFGCIRPILRGLGDIAEPHIEELTPGLSLVVGDLALSSFEDKLSDAWPRALDRDEAAFRTLSAFHRVTQLAGQAFGADICFFDVGPNLGAINRAALLASDFFITPLAPDLFSMQGLRNLGPTLSDWRSGWADRLSRNTATDIDLPHGELRPLGYIVMQAGMRLSRPVSAYERWVRRMPTEFHRSVLGDGTAPTNTDSDEWCLGIMRHYQSLMPLAQDAQKAMFQLRPGDGAIGAHMGAVQRCRADFDRLSTRILEQVDIVTSSAGT